MTETQPLQMSAEEAAALADFLGSVVGPFERRGRNCAGRLRRIVRDDDDSSSPIKVPPALATEMLDLLPELSRAAEEAEMHLDDDAEPDETGFGESDFSHYFLGLLEEKLRPPLNPSGT